MCLLVRKITIKIFGFYDRQKAKFKLFLLEIYKL